MRAFRFFGTHRLSFRNSVAEAFVDGGSLKVVFEKGSASFPSTWLSDQCRCSKCYHSATLQRLSDQSASIDHGRVVDLKVEDDHVVVRYEGHDHATIHPISHLFLAGNNEGSHLKDEQVDLGAVSVERVMKDDQGVLEVLKHIEKQGYAVVEGLEVTESHTQQVLEKIGYLRNSNFGAFWSFTVDTESTQERLEHADTAYTGLAIEVSSRLPFFSPLLFL